MTCPKIEICGGCPRRNLPLDDYRQGKIAQVEKSLSGLPQPLPWTAPVFIPDGARRRASMAFAFKRGTLALGFNQKAAAQIVDIAECPLLTPGLNKILSWLRQMLAELCAVTFQEKRGKKIVARNISGGDVWLLDADNGIDVVLEFACPLSVEHRMIICDYAARAASVARISHRAATTDSAEPIIEKIKPCIIIGGVSVYVPAGTFLQPSKAGETALTNLALEGLNLREGRVADLFCGVGTFSYVLAQNPKLKIVAADSSPELLRGFRETLNRNRISNVEVVCRNLFKYPFDAAELKGINAVIFDPPRAGAAAQAKVLASLPQTVRPQKIIAVSCYPPTFANDAKTLLQGGYRLKKITLVDQFVYSDHSELVALFTNE